MEKSFSVIIPTRNRPLVLEQCILRLLSQSECILEVVIVDSSSNDETKQLMDGYSRDYDLFTYHRIGDIPYSLVLARNEGVSVARGDIVAFIDDDCFILPGWAEEITKPFADSNILAVGGRIIYHPWREPKENGEVAIIDLEKDIIEGHWDAITDGPIDVSHLPGGNFAVRRDVVLAVGGFDPGYVGSGNLEETDFFLKVNQLDGRIIFNPCAVVEHRAAPRSDGITRDYTNFIYRYSMVRNRLYLLRKHKAGRGLVIGIRRQIVDCFVGTGRLLYKTIAFAVASLAGIVAGLTARINSDRTSL